MDSQSPLLHHPPPFLPPPPPPHSHGTMAAPPTPPPPQPHQQEQPISYILPPIAIFQQSHQQNNLQFPFNSVSGQTPKPHFVDHSEGSSAAAGVGVGAKKKRGRPRKYPVDGNNGLGLSSTPIAQIPMNHADPGVAAAAGGGGGNGAASSENSAKKGRGRPPGSGKKQKKEALGAIGSGFTPHLIHVHTGEDIVNKVITFSLQGPLAICILSASGAVCNVSLRQSAIGGGSVMYEGRFNIISLSGSFLLSESNGNLSRIGGLSVSLCGPDGRVLGGVVDGILEAATPVQLVMGSFIPENEKPMSGPPSSTPPPNMSNFGAPSPSPGDSSDSPDENGDSPLSHERGPFGNAAQTTHSMPTYWGQAM